MNAGQAIADWAPVLLSILTVSVLIRVLQFFQDVIR